MLVQFFVALVGAAPTLVVLAWPFIVAFALRNRRPPSLLLLPAAVTFGTPFFAVSIATIGLCELTRADGRGIALLLASGIVILGPLMAASVYAGVLSMRFVRIYKDYHSDRSEGSKPRNFLREPISFRTLGAWYLTLAYVTTILLSTTIWAVGKWSSPAVEKQLRSTRALYSIGNSRARHARWKEAAADFAKVVQLSPEDHWSWFQLAPLLIQTGELAKYGQHCHAMLARFGATTDPRVAERTAKACLLLPITGEDLATASKMADTAVNSEKDRGWLAYYQFAKCLAEYRQERFASALEWAKKALAKAGEDDQLAAQSYMVLAMAHHQLNETKEARVALDTAIEIVKTKPPKLESGDLTDSWHHWLISQILLRETATLIESGRQCLFQQTERAALIVDVRPRHEPGDQPPDQLFWRVLISVQRRFRSTPDISSFPVVAI